MRMWLYACWCVLLAGGITISAMGAPVSGTITAVSEGDHLSFQHDGGTDTIRLAGVDCPELTQARGEEARQFAASLVLNKQVSIEIAGKDAQGVSFADVTLSDGQTLNRAIVTAGLAWVYDQYPTADVALPGLMAAARTAKTGLWADPAPLAPWDFRGDALKEKKNVAIDTARSESELPTGGAVFVDRNGREFHKSDCVRLDKTSRHSMMLEEAQKQGYSPCRKCYPLKPNANTHAISAKGEYEDVPKEEFPKPAAAPVAPATPAAKAKPVVVNGETVPPEVAKYMDDPIVKGLGLEPYRDASGNFAGITAKSLSSFLPAALYGFKDNDVLQSVNGERIGSLNDIPGLVNKYKNQRSFDIGIVRDGQAMTINVALPDFIK